MKIIQEMDFSEFEPWSGAKDTYNRICECDKENEMENYIEEIFPDGCTDTELNDLLWYDSDNIYEYLGITEGRELSKQGQEYKVLSGNDVFSKDDIVVSLEEGDENPFCVLKEIYEQVESCHYFDYTEYNYTSISMEDLEEI